MILAPNGKPARRELRAMGMSSAIEAARRSGFKGYFYFPNLDPASQLTEMTFEESAKKLNWLYNNVPAASAAIDGLAEEEADTGMWPRATTSNPKFNKAVTDAFDRQCGDPRFFDEAGEDSFYTAQVAIRRNIYMLHDYFGQLLRPGEGTLQPTMNFIPSWMVGNPSKRRSSSPQSGIRNPQSDWINGTHANEFGRITEFGVFTDKSRKEVRSVPAGDMLHFHESLWKGQRRGMSPLTPAVRKWFSLDDIDRVADSGVLMRERIAYAITRTAQDDDEPTIVPGAEVIDTVEHENPDGTKTHTYIQRIVSADGTDIDIADLSPGRKLETVESDKASRADEYKVGMLTDIARATRYPPVYVFFVTGLTQGTEVRWVQKRVQRQLTRIRIHQLIPQFCRRWYDFWLWQNIARGKFDNVEGGVPLDWFLHRWNHPADHSVDIGREGRLLDDRLDSGKITPRAYHAVNSEDDEDVEEEILDARERVLKKIEDRRAALEGREPDYKNILPYLTYDLIFRESRTGVVLPAATAPVADPDDEEEGKPPIKKNGSRNGFAARL
jgi:Phage portal protein, lambda family